jgi:hypothetical protein
MLLFGSKPECPCQLLGRKNYVIEQTQLNASPSFRQRHYARQRAMPTEALT